MILYFQLDLITFLTAKISFPFLTTSIALHEVNTFLSKTAKDVVELSSRNWWQEISETTTIKELVHLLSHFNVHRISILNGQNKVTNIISQMDLLVFLYNNHNHFPHIMNETVKNIFSEKKIESIKWNQTMTEGIIFIVYFHFIKLLKQFGKKK